MKTFDNYLKTADTKQKLMIFLSFFLLLAILVNTIVSPMFERQDELQNSVDTLKTHLDRNSIKKLKRQLSKKSKIPLKKEEKLEIKKDKVDYLMSSLYDTKYVFFSDEHWVNALESILGFSVKRDIKIKSIKNANPEDVLVNIFKLKKSIEISGVGRYGDILALIQYIENFETLLEFNLINMSLVGNKVKFNFKISAYGVGL